MRVNVLTGALLALLPLVSAATTPLKEGGIEARADDPFVNTSDPVSLASNDGNITPASSDAERRTCPVASAALMGNAVVKITTASRPALEGLAAVPMGRSVGVDLSTRLPGWVEYRTKYGGGIRTGSR
ncbi:hypothetical protein OPQ81_002762 [Rhizoctonia solani]|nr:hypothetical protein OPQ81_002762 [Rhizoctonia solani]